MSRQPEIALTQSVRSLKSRVFRAGGWIVFGQIAAQVLRLGGNLIMTRLLTPDVFGIMAIASIVHVIISLLADIGLRQAVIQSPNGEKRSFLDTAWTLQVIQGWWIWGVCGIAAFGLQVAGTSGWVATDSVYASPVLPAVFAVSSFSAVLRGFQSMKVCVVNRKLDLKRLTQLELLGSILSVILSALFALATHSIWSFVAGGLIAQAIGTLLSYLWFPGPADRFKWDQDALHELMHFGKWIFISSALGVVASNGDRLLLAGWLDPAMLGNYSIALNLVMTFDGAATRLFSDVLMPAMSEVTRQSPERLPALYFRLRWLSDAAFVGMAGFIFAAGEGIVRLLFDIRYAAAGPMLQVLSFILIFSRYGLTQNAYLSLGRPSYITALNLVKLGSLFILLPGLYYLFGVQGAIFGIVFHRLPPLILMFWYNQRHGLNSVLLELTALCIWPLGWLSGTAFVTILHL